MRSDSGARERLRPPCTVAGWQHGRPMNRPISPPSLAAPVARYSLAVLSERPARLLHTAGIVGNRPDGTVPDDVGDPGRGRLVVDRRAAVRGRPRRRRHRLDHDLRRGRQRPVGGDGRPGPGDGRPPAGVDADRGALAGPAGVEGGDRGRRRRLTRRPGQLAGRRAAPPPAPRRGRIPSWRWHPPTASSSATRPSVIRPTRPFSW